MNAKDFSLQIDRLTTQWPNAYGPERKARIWQVYGQLSIDLFTEIVNRALDSSRSAPLVEDFSKIEQKLKEEKASGKAYDNLRQFNVHSVFEEAKTQNKRADPEFVKLCMAIIKKKLSGQSTVEEHNKICDDLDKLAKTYKYSSAST